MLNEIQLCGNKIRYMLEYKNVKNINLRIKPDGSIYVSANRRLPKKIIEEFLIAKTEFILKALYKCEHRLEKPPVQYFEEMEIREVITELCQKIYPLFEKRGVKYPEIKFRKMISQWGNCHYNKGVLTFNTELKYAPIECIEYVVAHEFTHFLQPNHSYKFYDELATVIPDWKIRRQKLKEIPLRG